MDLTANLVQGQGQPQDPFSTADAVNNRGITFLAVVKVFSRMLGPNKQPNNIQAHLGRFVWPSSPLGELEHRGTM